MSELKLIVFCDSCHKILRDEQEFDSEEEMEKAANKIVDTYMGSIQ